MTECINDACTQACTTECRAVIAAAYERLREASGHPVPAPAPQLRDQIAAAIYERNNPAHRWETAHPDDLLAYAGDADAVLAVRDTELQQLRDQLRFVAGYADAWYRSGAGATRECGRTILAALRPAGECRRCHCPAGAPQCEHCNCCDVPDPQEQP